MINARTLKALKNNDGLTLKNGKKINYKSGYQVATDGVECKTFAEAMRAIKEYQGTCGIWFSDGIYYIDKSQRISTKREALIVGRSCNQISILRWSDKSLIYC